LINSLGISCLGGKPDYCMILELINLSFASFICCYLSSSYLLDSNSISSWSGTGGRAKAFFGGKGMPFLSYSNGADVIFGSRLDGSL